MKKYIQEPTEKDILKKQLLKKASEETGIALEVVETIISFQFKDARKMASVLSEIDFGELGSFRLSDKKVMKTIKSMELLLENCKKALEKHRDHPRIGAYEYKVNTVTLRLEMLKSKLKIYENRLQRNFRRGVEHRVHKRKCGESS
jgi:hypothetical protein